MNNKYWRVVEPFKLVGENSIIWSKNQAQKVAVDISYYFLVLGVTLVGVYLFQLFQLFYLLPPEYPKELALKTGGLVLILGVLVRYFTSRIASVLLTFYFISVFALKIENMDFEMGPLGWVSVLMLMASIRASQASFYFHRKIE